MGKCLLAYQAKGNALTRFFLRNAPPAKKVKLPSQPEPAPRGLTRTYQTLLDTVPPGHQQHMSAPGAVPLKPQPRKEYKPLPPYPSDANVRIIPNEPLFIPSGSDEGGDADFESGGVREPSYNSSDHEEFPSTISQLPSLKVCNTHLMCVGYWP